MSEFGISDENTTATEEGMMQRPGSYGFRSCTYSRLACTGLQKTANYNISLMQGIVPRGLNHFGITSNFTGRAVGK